MVYWAKQLGWGKMVLDPSLLVVSKTPQAQHLYSCYEAAGCLDHLKYVEQKSRSLK